MGLRISAWVGLIAASSACTEFSAAPAASHNLSEASAAIIGTDGVGTISGSVVLNQYTSLSANAAAASTTLAVADVAALTSPLYGPLAAGDLLLVIQMQGATINTTDTATYGQVSALGGAGLYEYIEVASIAGNTITVASSCNGLKNSYSSAGRTQVVRVPQFSSLTVAASGTITALPWDGTKGGIVALHVRDTLTLQGTIDVSALGFRGGASDSASSAAATDVSGYRGAASDFGGEKGEGIAGDWAVYDGAGGRYGRGAPANGGGGANSYRGGGGGGANATNGNTWSGQGVMDGTIIGNAAWGLDPGRTLPTSTASRANNSGGGRGGYAYSLNNLNGTVTGPGGAGWGGNNRRERGGLGGRGLSNDPLARLFIGGGGGAGDGDTGGAGGGGRGGGLIYVMADTVSGAGALVANGAAGTSTSGALRDAAGGGGAGGSVVVRANTISGFSISSNGGAGGWQQLTAGYDEAAGPGGGGSGGFIATPSTAVTRSVAGGSGGETTSNGLTEFPANGATNGAAGALVSTIATVTGTTMADVAMCLEPADLSISLSNAQTTSVPGTATTYTLTVSNAGPTAAANARVVDTFPGQLSSISWTCTGAGGGVCPASGSGNINALVTLPVNGTATFTITATIAAAAATPGPMVNSAAVYSPPVINDPNLANNVAVDSDTLNAVADVSVALTASPDPVNEGANVTWSAAVSNAGPSQATSLSMALTLPSQVTFISASGGGWACSRAGSVVTCTRATLAPGNAPAISIVASVQLPQGTLTASATIGSTSNDPTASNDTASAATAVSGVNDPPVNTVPTPQTVAEDGQLAFSLATSNYFLVADVDVGTSPIEVTLSVSGGSLTLPSTAGLTFSNGDGTADGAMTFRGTLGVVNTALNGLTFAPTLNFFGDVTLTLTSNDLGATGAGGPKSDTDAVIISVLPVNDPPVLLNDTFTATEDVTSVFDVLANDSQGPDVNETLSVIAVTQPLHGLVVNGSTSVTYVPAANYFGPDSFTYRVSDGHGGEATASVSVSVAPVNDPPVANDDALSASENASLVLLDVLANDSIAPDVGETLAVTSVSSPQHGTATVAVGGAGVRYTPEAGYGGPDSFTYSISDGNGGTASATVSVTVRPANQAPVLSAPSAITMIEDATAVFSSAQSTQVAVSDVDAANFNVQLTLTASAGTLTLASTSGLAFSVGDGTADSTMQALGTLRDLNAALEGLSYSPPANFNGAASVQVTVNDLGNVGAGGAKTATATVAVTVTSVNDAPKATDDVFPVVEGATNQRFALLSNDSFAPDVDETLTITRAGPAQHGTVTLVDGNTAVTYTPEVDFFGTDSFSYDITDGHGGTSTATVVVNVANVNDPPSAVNDALTVAQDSIDAALDVLANDSFLPDPPETLTLFAASTAQHGTLRIDAASQKLIYTPTAGYVGPDTLVYVIADGNGGFASAFVLLTVGADSDRDGLSDDDERRLGTNPADPDSDHDLVPDGVEVLVARTDPSDDDVDDDGLIDGNEDVNHDGVVQPGETDPRVADSDGDGLCDGLERGLAAPQGLGTKGGVCTFDTDATTQTNPLRADTDRGGDSDGAEDVNRNGRVGPGETDPNNPRDDRADSDGDGLSDPQELALGLNPRDADSDEDGVLDGADGTQDSDGDGLIDALDVDSDNDGLLDGTEAGLTAETVTSATDLSKGHFVGDVDPSTATAPRLQDSDGDGLNDGDEDANRNGGLDDGETDASLNDTDADGLGDGLEVTARNPTDPRAADSDGDGLLDGEEDADANGEVDDGETNPNDDDSDGGGTSDGREVVARSNPLNPTDDWVARGGGGCSAGLPLLSPMGLAALALRFAGRRRLQRSNRSLSRCAKSGNRSTRSSERSARGRSRD